MRSARQRVVVIAIIAVLNAGWFYAVGCAALCAFQACPQRLAQAPEERCHHESSSPSERDYRDEHSTCPQHSFPTAIVVLPAGPNTTLDLQSGSVFATATDFLPMTSACLAPFVSIHSGSPPGWNGRTICQIESLLRI